MDRRKYGSKIHLITERTGLPLSVGIFGANGHDSQTLPRWCRAYHRSVPGTADDAQARQASRRQGLRLQQSAAMLTRPTHHTPERPKGDGRTPARGWDDTAGPSNAPGPGSPDVNASIDARHTNQPLPGLRQHHLRPHLLSPTRQVRAPVTRAAVGEAAPPYEVGGDGGTGCGGACLAAESVAA
ncbi:hypothetical protein [Streptomyces sp. CL12-4]|uniref:hypothetical protein n=1 Tax=Streptomyces sp. CL12-4 TaxID=2810306 RepID=UPI001FDE667A|nr:hypothetical protein [Streptomyces sp. CL12-4]